MSSTSVPKMKATWTPTLHKTFLDLCLEETTKGNKPGTYFTKAGWMNIVESFHKQSGIRYERKQIKNHWDFTREQWRTWCKLVQDSSMKWDPETNSFGASEEDWATYLKDNPDAAPYRFKELDHIDILKIIYSAEVVQHPNRRKRRSESSDASLSQTTEPGMEKQEKKKPRERISSEKSTLTSSHHKEKACWTPAFHDIFVDLCLEQKLNGNKPGTHFTKEGWKNIVELFNLKAGVTYDRIQIKNHWDATKEQWKVWCKLVGTDNMKWDPITCKFGATEEDWQNYLQANPEATQFRFKELQHADKLEMIFDRSVNTGESDTPTQHRRLNDNSPSSLWLVDGQGTIQLTVNMENHYDTPEPRSAVLVEKSPVELQRMNFKPSYSIGECIECLDGMEEVQQGSDLYLFALDLFLEKKYREIFLQLKNPSVRIAWLQRLQAFAPPLH
ncbi:hypothetical protein SLEP1_g37411 [Rubroshorea leprosula]|uniref:Myb/SANT-like domain-containing protein n=1 Tax=Rubroshorea leprosula TaxID=152421 RepID=A0AAV5KUK3_9ROSI|nr:hypothetical protein SLEP1_g37411 [Rubroshorea leprosula]